MFSEDNFLTYDDFSAAYIGYSNNYWERYNGASGGVLTAALKYIIRKKIVEKVIIVRFYNGKFEYYITNSINKIDKSKGSVYMPIYYNHIWSQIEKK